MIEITGQQIIDGSVPPFEVSESIVNHNMGGKLLGRPGGKIIIHPGDDRLFRGNNDGGDHMNPEEDPGIWNMGFLDIQGTPKTPWVKMSATGSPISSQYGVERYAATYMRPADWLPDDEIITVNPRGEVNGEVYNQVCEDEEICSLAVNLTRDFQIICPDVTESDQNHRSHIMSMEGGFMSIKNAEIRNLGPRGKLGRYPVHWHHPGNVEGQGIEGSVIWQEHGAGNRFITMHSCQGLKVDGNIGLGSKGHGFFMEHGDEYDNQVTNNLSIDVRAGEELGNADTHLTKKTAHFWLRAGNTIGGNIAAGNNWDHTGMRTVSPNIDGMILLPSTKQKKGQVVDGFTALNAGGAGVWSTIPENVYNDFRLANNQQSGITGWSFFNTSDKKTVLNDPVMFLNGNNELFEKTKNWNDRNSNVAQIYLNGGEVEVNGGLLAGQAGVHAHYWAWFKLNGVRYRGWRFVDVSYWELDGLINNCVSSGRLFYSKYQNQSKHFPPQIKCSIDVISTKVRDETINGTFTGSWLKSHFGETTPVIGKDTVIGADVVRIGSELPVPPPEPEPEPEPVPEPEPTPEPPPEPVIKVWADMDNDEKEVRIKRLEGFHGIVE